MRGISGLIVVASCALALAACGGSAHKAATTPSPTPSGVSTTGATESASASPTGQPTQTGPLLTGHGVSPGEVPPTRSSFSLPHTADGAIAFAGYVFRALDWSIATTDPYLFRQVSAPTCTACSSLIDKITSVTSTGGYSSGGRIKASDYEIVDGYTLVVADYVVRVTYLQGAQVIVPHPGATPTTYPSDTSPETSFLYLGWGGTGWQVLAVGRP